MNKHEAIKKVEQMGEYERFVNESIPKLSVLNILNQLDEPQKVIVPQFVADWIKYCKEHNFTLLGCLDPVDDFGMSLSEGFKGDTRKCIKWCRKESNTFARVWLDGYTVEKEKRYEVILCNGQSLKTVYRQGDDYLDFEKEYGDLESFTRKQLEEAGFGWVFDCPAIEIEEVEE